jgi:hypothetical protein
MIVYQTWAYTDLQNDTIRIRTNFVVNVVRPLFALINVHILVFITPHWRFFKRHHRCSGRDSVARTGPDPGSEHASEN